MFAAQKAEEYTKEFLMLRGYTAAATALMLEPATARLQPQTRTRTRGCGGGATGLVCGKRCQVGAGPPKQSAAVGVNQWLKGGDAWRVSC